MHITVFNGSPKAEKGNTSVMVKSFLDGARAAGASVENIFIANKNINQCRGCFSCWLKTPGKCVFKDDMHSLLRKVLLSDIIVFATPLYVDNVSGQMKQFLDRLIPLADPHIDCDKKGECIHRKRYDQKPPKLVVISNCGFPELSQFQILKLYFKRVARNMHSKVIGEIFLPQGELLTQDIFMLKPIVSRYKKLVRQCGKEIVENQKLSAKTKKQLEKPLVPVKLYVKECNNYFDKMLAKIK